jgi:hypothetical protein
MRCCWDLEITDTVSQVVDNTVTVVQHLHGPGCTDVEFSPEDACEK